MQNHNSEQKGGLFNWWVAIGLIIVTGAVVTILWQIISSLEGNSEKVHEYINKSKEDENDVHHMLKDVMPEEAPVGITSGKLPTVVSDSIGHFQSGLKWAEHHDDTQAVAEFSKTLEISLHDKASSSYFIKDDSLSGPGFQALVYAARASCYKRQEKYAEALDDLSGAIAVKPMPSYYSQRAAVYMLMDKPKLAAADKTSERELESKSKQGNAGTVADQMKAFGLESKSKPGNSIADQMKAFGLEGKSKPGDSVAEQMKALQLESESKPGSAGLKP